MNVWEIFSSLFTEGGWVLYPIFLVSVFSWYIAAGKYSLYARVRRARKRFLDSLAKSDYGAATGYPAYDCVLAAFSRRNDAAWVERSLDEFMGDVSPQLNSGLSTITVCIVIAPLLGLLGTISGMNEMFSIIGTFGFGSPTIMASGISMALKATLTGLAVAVVALFFLDQLTTRKTSLTALIIKDNRTLIQKAQDASPADKLIRKEDHMESSHHLIPENHEKPDINLAPFVDTIMILLIFFVVTANLYVETGIDVTKPRAQSATPSSQKAMLVGITREGTCHVFGRQVSLDKLKLLVEQEAAKQPDLPVVIIADRETQTGKTVEVMDQCALGGAQKISIAAGKD